jgi:hypothetical protein
LRSLQLISIATAGAPDSASAPPPPFGSNDVNDAGRTLLLAIDDDSFRPGREGPLRAAVDRLVAGLGPRDRISLVTMPYGGVRVPSTTDHTRVRTALSTLVGRGPASESGSALACRSRLTLESLTVHLARLGIRESAAIVMFVSAGLAGPRRDAPMMMAPGKCELTTSDFQKVGAAAAAARARFYIVQPEDLMARPGALATENIAGAGFTGSENPVEGLEHLAGVTGGKLLHLTGSADTALGRILRESAAYYLATVDPQPGDRAGRPLQLEIRVARAGVELRAPRAIVFARDPAGARSPREMIAASSVYRDLPLRTSGYAAPEPDGKGMRIVTITEPADPDVKLASLVAALFDRDGRLITNWVATPADLERQPVVGAMPAEAGAYRLRVAAIDTTGRSGTADYELVAELAQTGSLKLSSLVLGLVRTGGFIPKLQFSTEPVAIGYLELQGAAAGAKVTATLELASTVNGPSLVTVPFAFQSGGENRYLATGAIPIGALRPGDYVVRAIVGLEGQPATRVVQTLRKVAAR